MSLYVTSLHLVWGTKALAPREPGASLAVGTCDRRFHPTPGSGPATVPQRPGPTTTSSSSLQLPASRPDPAFLGEVKVPLPDVRATAGGWAAVASAKVPESGPPFWDAPSLAQGPPLRLRARTSRSLCPACWPEARLASGSWGLEELNHPNEGTKLSSGQSHH